MTLSAMAFPVLPGKTEAWRQVAEELAAPRKGEYEASRRRLGVRERVLLQHTPMGAISRS